MQIDPGRGMLEAAAQAATSQCSGGNPQEISNLIWAFARLSKMTFVWESLI